MRWDDDGNATGLIWHAPRTVDATETALATSDELDVEAGARPGDLEDSLSFSPHDRPPRALLTVAPAPGLDPSRSRERRSQRLHDLGAPGKGVSARQLP